MRTSRKNDTKGAVAALAAILAYPLAAAPTFQHDILPWFEKSCISCHGAKTPLGGLDLRTLPAILTGGKSGAAVVPAKPDESLMVKLVESGKMPMSGPAATTEQKALLREWIEKGQFPAQTAADAEAARKRSQELQRKHWAFTKPVKPSLPVVRASSRVRTPIDAFVIERLEKAGWSLSPDANPATLVRRAYLDLVGLPPPPELVERFVQDPSSAAYERLIDNLLASPQYGERWGRHWLDVAGYVESTGSPTDEPRSASWRYRDYVIRSFNQDKPFDEFLIEQFAGDQLVNYRGAKPAATSDTFAGMITEVELGARPSAGEMQKLIATGFLRAAPDGSDNQTIEQTDKWFDALQVSTEVPMKAVLGLQFACARCHDHKFDPILQEDYYRLVAVFQPALDPGKWLPANLHFGPWPARYIYDAPPQDVSRYARMVKDLSPKIAAAKKELTEAYRLARLRLKGQGGTATSSSSADGEVTDAELEKRDPALAAKATAYRRMEKELEDQSPELIWALWDVSRNPSDTKLLQRGDYRSPGHTVQPGIPKFLEDPAHPVVFPAPQPEWNHTGRRLALARWLTRPDHPLTARVFVNRVWQYHFGQGLVRTPDDYGSQGTPPTHPELLDWLATSFVENGWSVKWLHRQIMLSSAYRQASRVDRQKLAADPSNKLVWRKEPIRLEAEVIRDSMLEVAGELDRRMGGPSTPLHALPDGQFIAGSAAKPDRRRSIYVQTKRTEMDNFLQAFDAPFVETNVPVRFRSATPQQSLAAMNGPLALEMASKLAARVRREGGGTVAVILRAYQLVYQRKPEEDEISIAFEMLRKAPDQEGAWRTFCQALLGSNEFLYTF